MQNSSVVLRTIERETNNLELKKTCEDIRVSIEIGTIQNQGIVNKLSDYILKAEDAKLLQKYFSNILLAIVSARIPLKPVFSTSHYDTCSDDEKINHLEYSIVLAELSDHPDILQYTLKYFEINDVAPFEVFIHHEDAYNVAPKKRRLQENRQKITDYQIVKCCYNLMSKIPIEFCGKWRWNWTKFLNNFYKHENNDIRWMVKECIVISLNMPEDAAKALSDGMNIPEKTTLEQINLNKQSTVQYLCDEIKDNLCNSVVNIDGVLLPIYEMNNVQSSNLGPVKSTVGNLRSLALAVASGQAVCLMGPVGSGKTSLVEHLAAITGRKGAAFKKVQLGDQTDSRMLLGSHQCTDIPGEFIWRPGILTEAVQNGHWLMLEDIDCAALDVASTLSSLLERRTLCVPGYRDALPVTPGFQLFVTQRTLTTNYGFQKKMSNSSTLLQKHLRQINVEPLSRSELSEIIQTLYPSLKTICSRIIEVFMMFSVGSHDTSLQSTEVVSNKENNITALRGSRLISTRDLIKWCSRSVIGFDISSPDSALKVLQDALDIFTCSVSFPENRLELAKKISTCLGIVENVSEYYCNNYKPNVSLSSSYLQVGRAKVLRLDKSLETIDLDNKQVVFSFTRQSATLLEKIACCVTSNEPVLLVGETGTGKTSSVQYLARQTGRKLIVINMNQQSDSADLLGGYKPVDLKFVIRPIRNEFEEMFKSFFNTDKNKKFLNHIETCYETENWTALLALMKQSYKAAIKRLTNENKEHKLKIWSAFGQKLDKLQLQVKAASKLTFAFIEGSLVKAMLEGHWVLLDEINLASAEILECLAGLLEDKNETVDLLEKGDKVPIKRHPDFTLFACMNPATDVGKKDLPVGLRNRFTEFFIDELTERNDLMLLIGDYLYHMNLSGATIETLYGFYSSIRKEAKLNLVDGAGNAPHYSLRTLCRALMAAAKAKCGTVARSLYESFCLSFLTQLDSSSHPKVEAIIAKAVFGKKNTKSFLNQMIPEPQIVGKNFLLFEGHWIPQGKLEITIPEDYILTPTVRKNLRDIARIISLGRLPVLLQGDTSVGKTSLITYIAKASGNYCVRINNHEHTDLQEYIGSYGTDANGKLIFKEGVLVEAMRKGYWIILDELNLAPSDVLEALNRVLDDNRELFIPETQQVVRADPNFMLFATQNPPGLYGGRKMLSRAFRNRFVELHFDEIPKKELETILHQRCHVPPAYSKKMIAVMAELQIRRRGSAAVQGKDGFITLRDLFRWGQRYRHASKEALTDNKFYDWDQHIADEGYLILAGKVRQKDERSIIEEVIEKHIKRKVIPHNLFSLHKATSPVTKHILEGLLNNQLLEFSHIVWTYNMRRLGVLIGKAFTFSEPVLLIGETGCGKTTICQVLAAMNNRQLLSVNCHMHTESSDFLGGLRPVRQYKNDGRLFEWVDGPLIQAMVSGNMFLADEISLADDSVLERMNSLLEPERQLVLSERGMEDNSDIVVITAEKNFHFIGTMNPGGDFGKKELSPALRNRFTEIWCDSVTSREDLLNVLERSVYKGLSLGNQEDGSSGIGNSILDFTDWLKNSEVTNKFPFSIRDLLSWVQFINATVTKGLLEIPEAYVHGACMTFLDCFGTALTGHIDSKTLSVLRRTAINFLLNQIKIVSDECTDSVRNMLSNKNVKFIAECDDTKFGINPFYIKIGPNYNIAEQQENFTFTAPTTGSNTLRLLRGLQLNKAILLEGNPGVGKTSLVTALAKTSGHRVIRINLSDQTDITDLFGTDLPTEDGSFTFKEGAFLKALQNGDWILLDELNLAPQPVLEGLNACLDHRGEVFIPELGKTFKVKQETKLFACQNPLKQGGARRGLPISFLNRFTQVYIDTLTKEDLIYIVESQYSTIPRDILHRIIKFNCKVAHEITEIQSWGHRGSPWEMNLRDIQRWCEALIKDQLEGKDASPGKFVDMLYVNRMRTAEDKERMIHAYNELFYPDYPRSDDTPQFLINDKEIIIGDVILHRNNENGFKKCRSIGSNLVLLRNQLPILKALGQSVKMSWLSILVGPSASGKSSIVQVLADLTGFDLKVIPVTSAMDVSDLLGGFEQIDYNRNLENIYDNLEILTIQTVRKIILKEDQTKSKSNTLMRDLYEYKTVQDACGDNINEIERFKEKINFLLSHCDKLIENNEPISDLCRKIVEISDKLKQLKIKVSQVSCVNAGGKFEWVDSLLLKTMIEGSWLLLDNVNLTSAAVLDRLNGLLEPNGVLSITERGDVSDIKPHPNFRVFFTMDPKYGEISRAMRNRGIEIYLLTTENWNVKLSETMSYMDLTALLFSCGLPGSYHDICLMCHELMTSFIQGFEKPTVSYLLQGAHLTWQQLLRGINIDVALKNSFSDVYIKPRNGADFASNVNSSLAEMKNNMFRSLNELISKKTSGYSGAHHPRYILTVNGLCANSSLEIVKQMSYPISCLIQDASSCNKLPNMNLYALFLFFNTYQKCSIDSCILLKTIIEKDLKYRNNFSSNLKDLLSKYNEKAYSYKTKRSLDNKHLFENYYPECYLVDQQKTTKINQSILFLYEDLIKPFLEQSDKKIFSVLDYSKAVSNGSLSDDFAEYPILKQCSKYINHINANIELSLIHNILNLSNENTCRILQLLNWRNRLVKVCNEPIFVSNDTKKRPVLREEILPVLRIHTKWLTKYLMSELFEIVKYAQLPAFEKETKFLMANNEEHIDTSKSSKKLRKYYGQPKLYFNREEYDICLVRSDIYDNITLNMNQPLNRQLNKLSVDISSGTDWSFALDVPNEDKIVIIQPNLNKMFAKPVETTPGIVKLLPIISYIAQRVITLIQLDLLNLISKLPNCEQKVRRPNKNSIEILTNLIHLGKNSHGVSPALLNLFEVLKRTSDSAEEMVEQRITSVPTKFWDEFYKNITCSPAFYASIFINYQNTPPNEDTVNDMVPIGHKKLSANLPLLPYYVQKFTISTENPELRHVLSYKTISIDERANYSNQLGTILNMIWKNTATLETSAARKINSDADFELRKFEHLILYMYYIENNEVPNIDFDTDLVLNANHLKVLQKDKFLTILEGDIIDIYERLKKKNNEQLVKKILTAQLSLLTNMLFYNNMAEMSTMDHVEKYSLKIKYIEEDIVMFDTLLTIYYIQGLLSGTIPDTRNLSDPSLVMECVRNGDHKENLKKVHPFCGIMMDLKEKTAAKVSKYALRNSFRPGQPSYNSFVKDCAHFAKSIISSKTTTEISKCLISICNSLYDSCKTNTNNDTALKKAKDILKEATSWLYSINAFYKKLETTYSEAFPDLAKPLQSSISQIVYSVTSLKDLINELVCKIEQGPLLCKIVTDLMMYPSEMSKKNKKQQYLNRYVNKEIMNLLKRNALSGGDLSLCTNEDLLSAKSDCIEVLKMNLLELQMHCTATDKVDRMSVDAILATLNAIVKAWEDQQREMEKKKQDDEALYVTKSKCEDENEEAIAYEEILEMFPSYAEQDFSEFKPPSLEQKPIKTTDIKNKPKQLISTEDVSLVYKWHSSFVRNMTEAEWLPSRKKLVGNDVLSSFLQRYPTFSRIMENAWEALDVEFEGIISPSLMVLLSQIKAKIDGSDSSGTKFDFYRSAWVSESRQCVPLLHKVKVSTNALLDQWPDFPTLKEIIVIVNRILGFSVTSPVSRFLTGLELLRDKIEEWNKNAHKGNNLIDISLEVGQQIINWRKLEMSHWKECLNNLYYKKQSEAHKYWFYLYSVVNSYLESETNENAAVEAERIIAVLRDFMEKSNLAEYEIRLDIIYVYHCHLVHLDPSELRDELLSILWNTYNFYSQFSAQVAAYIKEKRAPIEKKLRDFVKICTWDRDLSYWSVKDTVDKAHKALHKHTKEFESVLKESVVSCFTDNTTEATSDHVGIWDRPKRATTTVPTGGAYMIDPTNHIVLARNIKKYLDQTEQSSKIIEEGSLLSKVHNLLNKAKTLCKDTITNTGYPSLVQGLDDFVTLVIETSTHLGSLEIDTSLPKEKQTSQAKNIVQQKRKSLADLFKYLTKMGLNYRTGLVILTASNNDLYDFTIPPVDLEAAMGCLKSRRCDASLALLWSGCEKYFQKNIARHRLLATALQAPHKDLGIQNIERCKGFAAHLLKLTNIQKKSISKYSRLLCDLRNVSTNLTNALDIEVDASNISILPKKLNILSECYANISILLEQFNIVLKSCPEKDIGSDFEPEFDSVLSDSKIVRCYKNSDEWKELKKKINSLLNNINKEKNIINKICSTMPTVIGRGVKLPNISPSHIDIVESSVHNLEAIIKDVDIIIDSYDFKFKNSSIDYESKHPLLRSIVLLSQYLKDTLADLINPTSEKTQNTMEDISGIEIISQSEDLLATMLLIIQSIYKSHLPQVNSENIEVLNAIDEIIDSGKSLEESKDILEDKHLKELLQDKLSNDSKMLQLDALISKTSTILTIYVQYLTNGGKAVHEIRNAVMRLVPILEQTVLFVQYIISQQVAVHRVSCKMLSVLLKIFMDLASKGFCKPSDLDMEDGEGEGGPGKLSGGTGLGDGEGQKDVSDKIENQDQLEDAHRPGEEKNEEDRDCKEEEKGVNMTDDFDSHLQDVEKKDGENDEDDNEENDADKQMGDLDNAAEKLDQQIWGSEDEEDLDEEKEGKTEKEEKGTGESTGEKEMGAKEEEHGTDDGTEGKDRKKKKDINEIDEPEVDDDHVDPYHGNQQQLPEPEDFEMPDNMDLDGEDGADKDGETETENPFDIDVMKENIPEDEKEDKGDQKDDNKNGLEVSSDEENCGEEGEQENQDNQENPSEEQSKQDEGESNLDNDMNTAEDEPDQPDSNLDEKMENPDESANHDDKEFPKNPEQINEEDATEDKKNEPNAEANPSSNDPTAEDRAENADMDKGTNDNVETNAEQPKDDDTAPFEQAQEQVGEDKQSTGRSELDKSDKGHRGEKQAASRAERPKEMQTKHENKPGRTDQERTLGDVNEKKHKQMKTLNVEKEDAGDEGGDDNHDEQKDADAFQHVKQAKKDDLQAIDAATKEQAEQQPTIQKDDDEDAEELKEDEQVAMDVDEEDIQLEKSEEIKPEKLREGVEKDKQKSGEKKEGGEEPTGEIGMEVEGDTVLTINVPRANETTYHTHLDESKVQIEDMTMEEYLSIRDWLNTGPSRSQGSATVWRSLWRDSSASARALCERLRLVLEPTGRSRMAGDFRTGRAINMRRVIPYIASHFRKDRIWLRRTKPAKREYKIAIAIDDSSSMADNRSKELAFESLALVSQALNLLESGDLAVLSFGEIPNLLHPFTEQFSEHSGSKILEQLRFNQTKTKIAQLLDFSTVLFEQQSIRSDALNAKLLVIVSDGRGIFSEGETKVLQAVRRARQQGIFLVYVIIDNPANKDSIMDIRRPLLDPVTNSLAGFVSYLDTFPFPFYLILRDMSALPTVLGDALRQWFELAANTS
ncbi:hypothetical protein K1T71_010207 [Dendrolimus kikuchii]|uniref:Uncharacterized protein n=1 Tax=Dendrolimus kikuchii TaxID=765133 RepID=A0ACC1CQZ0_9NEOP|nr:hypothetical protein K1T71_010207 [Dendrolimus kikuchii]